MSSHTKNQISATPLGASSWVCKVLSHEGDTV